MLGPSVLLSSSRGVILAGQGEEPLLEGHVQGPDRALLLTVPLEVLEKKG